MGSKRLTKRVAAVVAGVAAALSGAALAVAAARAPDSPETGVLKVRFGGDRAQTRVVIDLDKPTSVADVSYPAPGRLVAPLPKIAAPASDFDGAGQGLVRHWAVDRAGGQTRLSLDLDSEVTVSRRFLLPPSDGVPHWRYVIDLDAAPNSPPTDMGAATPAAKGAESPITVAANRLAAPFTPQAAKVTKITTVSTVKRKRTVVIDAGHGGKDPGALGNDSHEKDVTLAAAKALKKRLEDSGRYKVVMTRDSDVFIPLDQRVAIARKADADLFIALHADSGADSNTRGASVYTLSEKGTERVGHVLGPQGLVVQASGPGRDQAVSQILFDLTQRSTKNRSAAFAETLLDNINDRTPLLERSHREAGYAVLLAPDVPAVLLEMGFITNPEDERRLNSEKGRARLMDAVGDAIDAYFAQPVKLASN